MSDTAKAREDGESEKVQLNAAPTKLIDWFDTLGTENEFGFLSNFHEGDALIIPGFGKALGLDAEVEFVTGEHMFAAFKAANMADFLAIATVQAGPMSYGKGKKAKVVQESAPGVAKAMGRTIQLRPDWELVKLDVMALVLRTKFTMERAEGQRLLDTGDAYLQEGTWWNDRVWGVDLSDSSRPGRNWLGTLLMARRAELRNGYEPLFPTFWANLSYAGVGFPVSGE